MDGSTHCISTEIGGKAERAGTGAGKGGGSGGRSRSSFPVAYIFQQTEKGDQQTMAERKEELLKIRYEQSIRKLQSELSEKLKQDCRADWRRL